MRRAPALPVRHRDLARRALARSLRAWRGGRWQPSQRRCSAAVALVAGLLRTAVAAAAIGLLLAAAGVRVDASDRPGPRRDGGAAMSVTPQPPQGDGPALGDAAAAHGRRVGAGSAPAPRPSRGRARWRGEQPRHPNRVQLSPPVVALAGAAAIREALRLESGSTAPRDAGVVMSAAPQPPPGERPPRGDELALYARLGGRWSVMSVANVNTSRENVEDACTHGVGATAPLPARRTWANPWTASTGHGVGILATTATREAIRLDRIDRGRCRWTCPSTTTVERTRGGRPKPATHGAAAGHARRAGRRAGAARAEAARSR